MSAARCQGISECLESGHLLKRYSHKNSDRCVEIGSRQSDIRLSLSASVSSDFMVLYKSCIIIIIIS